VNETRFEFLEVVEEMDRTISVTCPQCEYLRYDLLHIDHECGGLLLKRGSREVVCKHCGEDMSYDVCVVCPACGYERVIDLVNIESAYRCETVKMAVFETILIVF